MYPTSTVSLDRLSKALQKHYESLAWMRMSNRELVERYAGTAYGKGGSKKKRQDCIELIWQTAEAYQLSLTANNPRFLCTSEANNGMAFARYYGRTMNRFTKEIRLRKSLEEVTRDSFFTMGLMLIHLKDSPSSAYEDDPWMNPGEPYAARVSPDNWVFDTCATDWRLKAFSAHRYRLEFEKLSDPYKFDQKAAKKAKPNSKYEADAELLQSMSRETGDIDELRPMIDLCDVYLAEDKVICTYAIKRDFEIVGERLAERDWDGPEEGNLRMLNLGPVPDNIIPTSPASKLRHLHDMGNSVFRKINRQSERQKTVTMYRGEASDDAKRVVDCKDGQTIRVDDPDGIRQMTWGGADPGNVALLAQLISLFDRMGGNVQAKLGLGAQSPTAAQDQMQMEQISRHEQAMQNRVAEFVTEVASDLGELLFDDPLKSIPGQLDLGIDGYQPVDDSWPPPTPPPISFKDMTLEVERGSMAFRPAEQRLGFLLELWDRFTANPEALASSGVQPDVREMLSLCAELKNEPRILDLFKFDQAIRQAEEEAAGQKSGGTSTRRYVRQNVAGGPSAQARDNMALQTLAAGSGRPALNQNQQSPVMIQ